MHAQRLLKRSLDIACASAALLLLAVPILLIAAAVRLSLGRPILFRQVRPGRNRQMFTVCKFRTMTDARDANDRLLPDSQRLTGLGKFLRKTSLDELPQLWNVVRGDMSMVGPRPLLIRYLPYYTQRESLRFAVPPGITGWAQVHGRNRLGWDDRLELDAWYVEHWSLWLDLYILWLSLFAVISRRGLVVDPRSSAVDLDEQRMCQLELSSHASPTSV